ncbi:hypothetical protein [Nonomuraea sp. NPDC049784]|uniref:hypothetical protein n=1 Tax=Nonomuraea sp. NPDC049784 TaxID=3154361 RepID=UPI0034089A41
MTEPAAQYPWSLLWHETSPSTHVAAVIDSARRLSRRLGWLEPTRPAPGDPAVANLDDRLS